MEYFQEYWRKHYSGDQGCWDSLRAKLTLLVSVVKAEFPSLNEMTNHARAKNITFNEQNQNSYWAFVYCTWRKPDTKNWIESRLLSRKINSWVIFRYIFVHAWIFTYMYVIPRNGNALLRFSIETIHRCPQTPGIILKHKNAGKN